MTSSQSSKFFRVAIVSTVISEFQGNLRMTGSAVIHLTEAATENVIY